MTRRKTITKSYLVVSAQEAIGEKMAQKDRTNPADDLESMSCLMERTHTNPKLSSKSFRFTPRLKTKPYDYEYLLTRRSPPYPVRRAQSHTRRRNSLCYAEA